MSLKELNLKKSYDSDVDDILNDFYISVLSNAVIYKRLAGFFSSSSLAIAARGLSEFINNGGEMKLITSAKLQQVDADAIYKAHKNPEEIIEKMALDALSNIENEFVKDHVSALGWMIANDKLEIKIALINQDVDDKEEKIYHGMFHQKVGILEDASGNKISFSGSDNESATSWIGNIEEFKVFRNWVDSEKDYLETDDKRFDKFWEGESKRMKIIEASEAIKRKLIEYAPKDIREINLKKYYDQGKTPELSKTDEKKKVVKLRYYQNEAIENWIKNNSVGVFEMATGTGKTLTAIGCLEKVLEKNKKLLCLISVPYNHLISQWKRELNEIIDVGQDEFSNLSAISSNNQIKVGSSQSNWKKLISNKILDLNNNLLDRLIIYTSHNTLSSEFLIGKIEKLNKGVDVMVIVDEVHGIGSAQRKRGLLERYKYRLGLSATPKRWMDDEGTAKIYDFFNKTVFEFPIEKAIKEINPDTGKTYLTPYDYYPFSIELTDDETQEYIEITKRISRLYHYKNQDEAQKERYELLLIKRANIIKSAHNKLNIFREILNDIKEKFNEIAFVLAYCNPGEQFMSVQNILIEAKIKYHNFTSKEGVRLEKRFNGLSERDFIIKDFIDKHFQVLVAMKCLDEGIDIPSAKYGIILASSTNPREFIQRRGRILRQSLNKTKSYIYDIIVLPPIISGIDDDFKKYDQNIIKKELIRYKEFSNIADNSADCLMKLVEIEEKLNLI